MTIKRGEKKKSATAHFYSICFSGMIYWHLSYPFKLYVFSQLSVKCVPLSRNRNRYLVIEKNNKNNTHTRTLTKKQA